MTKILKRKSRWPGSILWSGSFLLAFLIFPDAEMTGRSDELVTEKQACDVWGTPSEKTTFQRRYHPLLDRPDIPVRSNAPTPAGNQFEQADANAVSPETAVYVVQSNGYRYSYFYSYVIRYQYVPGDPPRCVPVRKKVRMIIPYAGTPATHPGIQWFQESDAAMIHFQTKVE